VTQARLLSHNIAQKTGHDPHRILKAIHEATCSILKKNESVVREIATVLDRVGVVRRKELASILAKIERPS
jgi:hypothetical protein